MPSYKELYVDKYPNKDMRIVTSYPYKDSILLFLPHNILELKDGNLKEVELREEDVKEISK